MSNEKILNSFEVKDELNPKFWDENKKLNPQVRERLLKIAQEFIDFISVPIVVEDILFIGSLTNYGWSEYSDIDLHVSIDFNQFPKENLRECEMKRLKDFINEHIVKVGSQYRLVSKKSGKNLGTYSTRAGALNRERQVQYFKSKG